MRRGDGKARCRDEACDGDCEAQVERQHGRALGRLHPKTATVRAAVDLAPTGPAIDITKVSPADRAEIAALWKTFGPGMVPMHEKWHSVNGSGGTQGPGSGEKFMQFHANLMKDFRNVLATKAPDLYKRLNNQLPAWDTTLPLPKEFWFPGMLASAKGPHGVDWTPPAYLTAKGGGDSYVLNDANQHKTIRSLNDITSADELGRVLGASGMHAVGHVRLGGKMNTFASIATPPFQLWHGKMEEIRAEWLKTPSGQAAAKAHPPDGFLDPNANSHSALMKMPMGDKATNGAPPITDAQFGQELTEEPRSSRSSRRNSDRLELS